MKFKYYPNNGDDNDAKLPTSNYPPPIPHHPHSRDITNRETNKKTYRSIFPTFTLSSRN
jgi:hypothetical protein